jgi:hypothetical protein
MLDCPANTYSDVVPNAGETHLKCQACPDGKVSVKGSFSLADCYRVCDAGSTVNPNNPDECLPCSENSTYNETTKLCVCNPGFTGIGAGAGACAPCPVGSYCPGGRAVEQCSADIGQYSDAEGAAECKYCPPASVSSNGETCTCVRLGRKFNNAENKCE